MVGLIFSQGFNQVTGEELNQRAFELGLVKTPLPLVQETVVGNLRLKTWNNHEYYPNGMLKSVSLAEPTRIALKGTPYEFEGTLVFSLTQQIIGGTLKGRHSFLGGEIQGKVGFHDDGNVSIAELVASAPIGTHQVPVKSGTGVHFHENGEPYELVLNQDFVIQGYLFPGGSEIQFRENGNLLLATPSVDMEFTSHRRFSISRASQSGVRFKR